MFSCTTWSGDCMNNNKRLVSLLNNIQQFFFLPFEFKIGINFPGAKLQEVETL